MGAKTAGARLAELCGVLSIAGDLVVGEPIESGLRSTLIAVGVADVLGLSAASQQDVFYLNLLRRAGTTATPTTDGAAGDEGAVAQFFRRAVTTRPPMIQDVHASHCDVAKVVATRLGATPPVLEALEFTYERFDGTGTPRGKSGADIPLIARVTTLAHQAEIQFSLGGIDHAISVIRERVGTALDREIVHVFRLHADEIFEPLFAPSPWAEMVAREPGTKRTLDAAGVDQAVAVLGNFAEPFGWMRGHGRRVAALVGAAAPNLTLSETDTRTATRAAHIHDFGNVALSLSTLGKPGPLNDVEWDEMHRHAAETQNLVGRAAALRAAARLAGMHHERPNGSGYPRRLGTTGVPRGARLLAAADAYDALTNVRPWRPARPADVAAKELETMASDGRLDPDAVNAVLDGAGRVVAARPTRWPLELTGPEVAVLRAVAGGASNRRVARTLRMRAKTVETHLESIYPKLGVTTRAGAAMSAVNHGLLDAMNPT